MASSSSTTCDILPTMLCKNTYTLSESMFISVGLEVDNMSPTVNMAVYLVDRLHRERLYLSVNCLSKIAYGCSDVCREEYFREGVPTYTEFITLYPTGDRNVVITPKRPPLGFAQPEDPDELRQYCCAREEENARHITLTEDEYCRLCNVCDSVDAYYNMCATYTDDAHVLFAKYKQYFVNKYSALVETIPQQERCDPRVREGIIAKIRTTLPPALKELDVSSLPAVYDSILMWPVLKWLDADLRAFCADHLFAYVLDDLKWKFSWLRRLRSPAADNSVDSE